MMRRTDYYRLEDEEDRVYYSDLPYYGAPLLGVQSYDDEYPVAPRCLTHPLVRRIARMIAAGLLSMPSVIIASSNGTLAQPAFVSGITSAIANFFMNSTYDLSSVIFNFKEASARLKNCHPLLRVVIYGIVSTSIVICGFSLGGLTFDSYPWGGEAGKWFFLIAAICATIFQRASGTCGFIAEFGKHQSKKNLIKILDIVISITHFLVGIPILLDMYTPKSYSGLNRCLEIFTGFQKNNLICDDKNCQVSPGLFSLFASFSTMHLIFFCWAARSPLQRTKDSFKFFFNSNFAQELSFNKKIMFKVSLSLAAAALAVTSFYSVHGLVGADIKGRAADPAGIDLGIFDSSEELINYTGTFFFMLVNLMPIYVTIPKVCQKLGWFLPPPREEKASVLPLTALREDVAEADDSAVPQSGSSNNFFNWFVEKCRSLVPRSCRKPQEERVELILN